MNSQKYLNKKFTHSYSGLFKFWSLELHQETWGCLHSASVATLAFEFILYSKILYVLLILYQHNYYLCIIHIRIVLLKLDIRKSNFFWLVGRKKLYTWIFYMQTILKMFEILCGCDSCINFYLIKMMLTCSSVTLSYINLISG